MLLHLSDTYLAPFLSPDALSSIRPEISLAYRTIRDRSGAVQRGGSRTFRYSRRRFASNIPGA